MVKRNMYINIADKHGPDLWTHQQYVSHTSSVEPEDIMGNQHRIRLDMTEEK